MMHCIYVLGKESNNWFYIEYINIYQRISFMDKGISLVQRLHVKYDKLKVIWFCINSSINIVYIVDDIFIFSNPCLYNMLCLRLGFQFPPIF